MGVVIPDYVDALETSRARLFASIQSLTEEQFRFVPPGEEWNVAAHLAHLLRVERVYTDRARIAVVESEPFVASTRVHNDDDPALAQRLAVPQIVHGLLNVRRELTSLLDTGDDATLSRAIRHETLGRMTIQQIAEKMAEHEGEHASEIIRLIKVAPASARVSMAHVIPVAKRS